MCINEKLLGLNYLYLQKLIKIRCCSLDYKKRKKVITGFKAAFVFNLLGVTQNGIDERLLSDCFLHCHELWLTVLLQGFLNHTGTKNFVKQLSTLAF